MKKNYLAIISRNDYNLLFRYGYFRVNGDMVIPFDCSSEELPTRVDIADKLFEDANPFAQMDSIMVLHYSKNEAEKIHFDIINIDDVEHIYPLTVDAQRSFESSFDHRVRIDTPLWGQAAMNLRKRQKLTDMKMGIHNLSKIFGLEQQIQASLHLVDEASLHSVAKLLVEGGRPSEDDSLWTYLLMYERHDTFPKDVVKSNFLDVITVVSSFLMKEQVFAYDSDVCNRPVFLFVESLDNSMKFKDIIAAVQQSEDCMGFLNKVNELCPEIDFIKVAVLFLRYKEHFINGFKVDNYVTTNPYEKYGNGFEISVMLLGAYFGHEKTADCFYEHLPLKILKDKSILEFEQKKHDEEVRKAKEEVERRQKEREQGGENPADPFRGRFPKEGKGKKGKGKGPQHSSGKPNWGIPPTSDGRPLRPLQPEDKVVEVDGKRRVVTTLNVEQPHIETASSTPSSSEQKFELPSRLNDGRIDLGLNRFPLKMSKELTKRKPIHPNFRPGKYVLAQNEEEFQKYKEQGYIYY